MPVICDVCGSSNRENAMFCVGCAGRLPGFVSSGPSALEAMMALRPPSHALAPGKKAKVGGAAVSILPAEAPAFWFRLGLVGMAMFIVFIGWYMYVTRKVSSPPPAAMEVVTAPATPATPATPALKPAPVAEAPRVVSPPVQADAPAAPAAKPVPAPAVASMPDTPAKPEAQRARAAAEAPPVRARTQTADARTSARQSRDSSHSEQVSEPSPEALRRALALAEAEDESPRSSISYGTGSSSGAVRRPSRTFDDGGPPPTAGPGPLFEATRPAVRAPAAGGAADLGPPIAIGPGPLVDYSTRGAGPR